MTFEKTRIHFNSEIFAAVAFVVVKFPYLTNGRTALYKGPQ